VNEPSFGNGISINQAIPLPSVGEIYRLLAHAANEQHRDIRGQPFINVHQRSSSATW